MMKFINIRDGQGCYFFHGAGWGREAKGQKSMVRGGAGNPIRKAILFLGGKENSSPGLGWG